MLVNRKKVKAFVLFWPVPYFAVLAVIELANYLWGIFYYPTILYLLHLLAIVWLVGLNVFMTLHINGNDALSEEERKSIYAVTWGNYINAPLTIANYYLKYIIK